MVRGLSNAEESELDWIAEFAKGASSFGYERCKKGRPNYRLPTSFHLAPFLQVPGIRERHRPKCYRSRKCGRQKAGPGQGQRCVGPSCLAIPSVIGLHIYRTRLGRALCPPRAIRRQAPRVLRKQHAGLPRHPRPPPDRCGTVLREAAWRGSQTERRSELNPSRIGAAAQVHRRS